MVILNNAYEYDAFLSFRGEDTRTGRGVHGSGGSGLCPTREPTRKRSGGIFSTRNRPVKGSSFAGRFSGGFHRFRVRPKPDGKHRKMAKIGDISPDPAKIR